MDFSSARESWELPMPVGSSTLALPVGSFWWGALRQKPPECVLGTESRSVCLADDGEMVEEVGLFIYQFLAIIIGSHGRI